MTDEVFPNGNRRQRKIDVAPQRDDPARFSGLLSEAEIEDLRKEAREAVLAEQKKRESDALYYKFLDEERKAHDPKKKQVPVFLQLAGHAQYIMLDGTQYHTNNVYNVTEDVYAVLIEQMNRGWAHEELTEVRETRTRRRFRPPVGIGYGNFMDNRQPRNLTVSTAEFDGALAGMRSVVVPGA
jgi:hypothetical protein